MSRYSRYILGFTIILIKVSLYFNDTFLQNIRCKCYRCTCRSPLPCVISMRTLFRADTQNCLKGKSGRDHQELIFSWCSRNQTFSRAWNLHWTSGLRPVIWALGQLSHEWTSSAVLWQMFPMLTFSILLLLLFDYNIWGDPCHLIGGL